MNQSAVLQIVALFLIVLGGILLYTARSAEGGASSLLSGVGPIIVGAALFLLSRSKTIRGKR